MLVKLSNLLKYGRKRNKPRLWKRMLMAVVVFFANIIMRIFGEKTKLSIDEIKDHKKREDEEIIRAYERIIKRKHEEMQRKKRGALIKPSKFTKKGEIKLSHYGKFIDPLTQKEIKPIIKPELFRGNIWKN